MSGGLNQKFLNDPKGFLRSHIIEMSSHLLPGRNNAAVHLVDFNLVPVLPNAADGTSRCRLEAYNNVTLMPGGAHGAHSHPIRAFWLPYVANTYCETTLDNQAKFMFTDTLTGCSIGIGSGPNPKCSHINYQAGGGIDHNRVVQKYNKHFRFDADAHVIHKDDYYGPNDAYQRHTIVGIRGDEGWKFYMNSRGTGIGAGARLLHGLQKMHATG